MKINFKDPYEPPCGKLEIQGGNQQSKFEIPGNYCSSKMVAS